MNKKYIYIGSGVLLSTVLLLWLLFSTYTSRVNLVYMSDSKYLPYMMVSLNSAIKHKKTDTEYNVYVIAKNFTPSDDENLQKMAEDKVKINIIPAKNLNVNTANLGRFSSFAITLQKLFIADYLAHEDKILYLDADTLVQQDLAEVYKLDISDKYAAAVKDGLMYQYPQHIVEIGLADINFYFNSGVMLLNLEKIRQDEIMHKSVIYLNTHREVFGDQDILNVAFGGKVLPLSYKYNCNSTFFEERSAKFLSRFYDEVVPQTSREVYDTATILHFAGHKPWTPWFTHTYLKPLWQQYADETKAKYHITF